MDATDTFNEAYCDDADDSSISLFTFVGALVLKTSLISKDRNYRECTVGDSITKVN